MSQFKLAQELSKNDQGIKFSQPIISGYETGLKYPSLKRAKIIANYFKLPIEAINFGTRDYSEQSKLTGS
jgi:transcriptional regulator with XRE-family HTH domain